MCNDICIANRCIQQAPRGETPESESQMGEATIDAVSTDASSFSTRETPRRRPAGETVADFTMLVRVPGKPASFRAFTEPERREAEQYAERTGGTLIELPLPLPDSAAVPPA